MDALELIGALPTFTVSSAGAAEDVARLTLQSADQSFPRLARLAEELGHGALQLAPIERCGASNAARVAAERLKQLFDHHGSDKARGHNYHHLYGAILHNPEAVSAVFEIGLGTNHEDVVSNMGHGGRPGASLRAFRDFLPNAQIFGADVDQRILFSEDRIRTFFIDQTDMASMDSLSAKIAPSFDLILDDGLHTPGANLAAILFGLKKLKVSGVFVVEDIHPAHFPVWQVVAALLPRAQYNCFLIAATAGCLFALQRIA
jgi:hypothetical protein